DDQVASTATRLTGFTDNWDWASLTMSNTQPTLDLTAAGSYTLNVWMRQDGLRLDRLLLITDTNYIPAGIGPAESPSQIITNTIPGNLTSHVIRYTYDDLYRLINAAYTGDITATFRYAYDPVGNMKAYTQTVTNTIGITITRVTRTFDDANRLQTSFDYTQGTSSYLYDNNGNLTLLMPPGGDQWKHYAYNQRNLMISHTLSVSGTNPQLQAQYVYDGNGNRVQQIDRTGPSPITTTYVNDIVGLTQVLVADNGTTQTTNLFGLDLVGQDNGTSFHTLLTDGLGSVRSEIANGDVAATATYDPFGNTLDKQGTSSAYGYTGEQFDDASGLLYLRARYYNPNLHSFMGKDMWSGFRGRPQTMNGWSYVNNNVPNLVDPTGKFPEDCRSAQSYA
ncbi:MAG: RHS repeat-associated core domain-containing protein, partial [Chloroflexi bacterium]|nr:RHS repeat-associated core domain-containing protein [Chloroflexota bacterium]